MKRLLIALVLAGTPILAQRVPADVGTPARPYVEATGDATISAKPDQVIIQIGVVTENAAAAAAASKNAEQTDAALAEVRKLIGPGDQVKTTGYSVRPNYKTPNFGAPQKIDSYTASNTVQVILNDLTLTGKVIDAALRSGVNSVQRIQFGLKNPQAARSQALKEAAIQARANAEAIAEGLGVHIARVLSAQEGAGSGQVLRIEGQEVPSARRVLSAPTEVDPGTIDVHVTLTLRAEVSQ